MALFLGGGVAGLLGLTAVAASLHGSPLRAGAPESSDLPATLFLACAAAAFALYVAGLYVVRRRGARLAWVCAVAAAVQLIPLAGPLLLSRDVYAYWAYGRLAEDHDANPYAIAPARFPADPAERAMARGWRRSTSVYGPAFTAASAGLSEIDNSAETTAFTYRALSGAGMLAVVGLAAATAPIPAFAAAFAGWNPLLALSFAGGGHNDAWMMAFVLAGLALASRRPRLGGASWALAGGVKWIAVAFLPFCLLRESRRDAVRIAAWFLAAAGVLALGAFMLFGTAWLGAILPFAHRHAHWAIPSRLGAIGLPPWLPLLALLLALPFLIPRGRPRLGAASALLLVASPWLLPWYAVWAVPLAAVEEDRLGWVLALAVSGYLLSDRVPV